MAEKVIRGTDRWGNKATTVVVDKSESKPLTFPKGRKQKYKMKGVDAPKGVWRTIRGRHIFIRDGETLDESIARLHQGSETTKPVRTAAAGKVKLSKAGVRKEAESIAATSQRLRQESITKKRNKTIHQKAAVVPTVSAKRRITIAQKKLARARSPETRAKFESKIKRNELLMRNLSVWTDDAKNFDVRAALRVKRVETPKENARSQLMNLFKVPSTNSMTSGVNSLRKK